MLNYLICPIVQNFFIDFRKKGPVSNFILIGSYIEGA